MAELTEATEETPDILKARRPGEAWVLPVRWR